MVFHCGMNPTPQTKPMPETFRGYPVRLHRFELAGRTFVLLAPANYEELIDDPRVRERFAKDEYLPYWAEFWPACLLLADAVAAWGAPPPGQPTPRVLELGCGLGLVSLLLSHLGYAVTAADYDEEALAFVLESARRNGLNPPQTQALDWRDSYPDLCFDRIVAAEVLYETRSLRPVAEFIYNHLAPQGFALISDANRSTADSFEAVARHCGLTVVITPAERPGQVSGQIIRGRLLRVARKPAATDRG
jgi:2-polyprenyl-3-methyl-5-hydroxy-6-metoxy-1,4-benzoquinol methylase